MQNSYLNILKKLIGSFLKNQNNEEINDLIKTVWITEQLKLKIDLNEIASILYEDKNETYLKYMTEIFSQIKYKCDEKNILPKFPKISYINIEIGSGVLTLKEVKKNIRELNKIIQNFYKNPIPTEIMLLESSQKILSAMINDDDLKNLIPLIELVEMIENLKINIDYEKLWDDCRSNCQRYEGEYSHYLISQIKNILNNLKENLNDQT